jgi:hypothetical protein
VIVMVMEEHMSLINAVVDSVRDYRILLLERAMMERGSPEWVATGEALVKKWQDTAAAIASLDAYEVAHPADQDETMGDPPS